jgi:hypothetical protein
MSSESTWSRIRPLIAAGVSSLLFAACSASISIGGGGGPDLGDLEAKLVDLQEEKSPDLSVEGAHCPEDTELEKGATFECTVTIEGVEAPYTITMTEDDPDADVGSFHVEASKAIIDVSLVKDFIKSQVTGATGEVEVDCGPEKVIVSDVGGIIDCTVSDDNGTQDVQMVVKDKEGTVTFKN